MMMMRRTMRRRRRITGGNKRTRRNTRKTRTSKMMARVPLAVSTTLIRSDPVGVDQIGSDK